MKVIYAGHEETKDGAYRLFLLKENDKGEGMKPLLKFSQGIGLYFPKSEKLPSCKIGEKCEIYFDEAGKILFPQ